MYKFLVLLSIGSSQMLHSMSSRHGIHNNFMRLLPAQASVSEVSDPFGQLQINNQEEAIAAYIGVWENRLTKKLTHYLEGGKPRAAVRRTSTQPADLSSPGTYICNHH